MSHLRNQRTLQISLPKQMQNNRIKQTFINAEERNVSRGQLTLSVNCEHPVILDDKNTCTHSQLVE